MSNKDSFDKEFATLRELGQDVFVLRGATIIVEIQPEQELKTAGGLVLSAPSDHVRGNSVAAHKLDIGKVLMTGPGYWDEDKNCYEPLDVKPGAIVILPQYTTSILSMFPGIQRPTGNKLGMVKADSIVAYYPTPEAFELAQSKLK